jgi:hypothetical protein
MSRAMRHLMQLAEANPRVLTRGRSLNTESDRLVAVVLPVVLH